MSVVSGGLTVVADGLSANTASDTTSALEVHANSPTFKGSAVNMRTTRAAAADFNIYVVGDPSPFSSDTWLYTDRN